MIIIKTILITIWIVGIVFLYLLHDFFNTLGDKKTDLGTVIFKIIFWPLYILYRVLGGKK